MTKQAKHTWAGKTLLRWYVYAGSRRVGITWAESEAEAYLKARKAREVVTSIQPAPPLLESDEATTL